MGNLKIAFPNNGLEMKGAYNFQNKTLSSADARRQFIDNIKEVY